MNKVLLIGRLTKDADIRLTTGADTHTIARCTLAVDRRVAKNDYSADFIPLQAWDKKAEFLERFGKKGVKFAIVGRIQTGSYTNKDGATVYTTDVVVEEIEFCESKNSDNAGAVSNPTIAEAQNNGFINIPVGIEDELPFT